MTRESGSKADLRILWMGIDDEVLVRRHRVHARGGVRNLSIQRRNREVEDEVKRTTLKHRIAEIHAISMKQLSKVETADDPSDGADDE